MNDEIACPLDFIPLGEMRCVSVGQRKLLIAHTNHGVYAAAEVCTHEDARLCDGNLTDTLVKCPLHGSRFDLRTGQVLDDPATENLQIFPTKVVDQQVVVTLPEN